MKTQTQTQNKALVLFFMLILIVMGACQKDNGILEIEGDGKAVFSLSDTTDTNFKSTFSIDDAAAIIISIENENGILVYNQEQLQLLNMNGKFLTKALALETGNYLLTEFLVIDSNGQVIYLTPKNGSLKAELVDSPLPILFSIYKDEVTQLAPEVVSSENSSPEDFGYTTFTFNIVETLDFKIGVLVYNSESENFELTTANLSVNASGVMIFEKDIEAITNIINLDNSYSQYTLIVEKSGYENYEESFTNEELQMYFSSLDYGPLMVTLEEANASNYETVSDIDGNIYSTVKIGNQKWMAENLKTTRLNDGTAIVNVTSGSHWGSYNDAAYAWQNNDIANKDIYGALYNYIAIETGSLCPVGWKVPTDQDWTVLTNYADNSVPGTKLKSCKQDGSPYSEDCNTDIHPRWDYTSNYYGTDDFGFSATPGGFRNEVGSFGGVGSHGFWWSSTLMDNNPIRRSMRSHTETVNRSWGSKNVGFSVRCIKE